MLLFLLPQFMIRLAGKIVIKFFGLGWWVGLLVCVLRGFLGCFWVVFGLLVLLSSLECLFVYGLVMVV